MKKIMFLALVCCVVIISGCSHKNVQETVMNTYKSWKEMNMSIWIIGPTLDSSEDNKLIDSNGSLYYRVDDDRYQSIEDIKKVVEETCTSKYAENIFYKPYLEDDSIYYEKEGILYKKMVEIPANYGGELINVQIIENKADYICAKLEYYDELLDNNYTIEITTVLQNEVWLVDSLIQVWQ